MPDIATQGKIALAAIDRGLGAYEAAPLSQVSASWIYKVLARRRESGESTARPQVNHAPPKRLAQQAAIRLKLKAEPDLTLAELRTWAARGASGLDQLARDVEDAAPA